MESKQLMIGDWVYNTHHKKNIQITAYDFFTHHHNNDGTQSFLGIIEPKTTSGFDLKPIPLTDEMLKANGFVYQEVFPIDQEIGIYYTIRRNGICVNIVGEERDVVGLVRTVHELQHALRLCGLNELADNFKIKAMEGKV